MAVRAQSVNRATLNGDSSQEVCRLIQKCAASLSEARSEIDQYVDIDNRRYKAEKNIVLLPPAYLELLRRRDNLVLSIASIAEMYQSS